MKLNYSISIVILLLSILFVDKIFVGAFMGSRLAGMFGRAAMMGGNRGGLLTTLLFSSWFDNYRFK